VGTSYGNELSFTTLAAPTLTTTAISSITGTSATSGGTVTSTGGAALTAVGVCWSTSQNPTIALPTKTNDGTANSFTSNLSGLTAGTTYYVRAYATNSAGTSYGSQVSFATAAATPTVTTTAISSIAANSANSGGEVTSIGGSALTAVGICWSTSQNPTIANSNTNNGTATSFTSNLTGLAFSTTYYVRAYATNAAGTSYGNQVSFATTAPASNTPTFTSSITVSGSTVAYNFQISDYGATQVTECGFYYSYNTKYTDISLDPNESTFTVVTNSNNGSPITGTADITFLIAPYYFIPYVRNSNGYTYGTRTVLAPNWPTVTISDKLWSGANIGAVRVATSSTDASSYGFKYQWGRGSDGHQLITSGTTTTTTSGQNASHGSFNTGNNFWSSGLTNDFWNGLNGINNPCPTGWRLPTSSEITSFISNNSGLTEASAYSSVLKMPASMGRDRNTALVNGNNANNLYWMSYGTGAVGLQFSSGGYVFFDQQPNYGGAIRCVQN
jgi:hypothetical protein